MTSPDDPEQFPPPTPPVIMAVVALTVSFVAVSIAFAALALVIAAGIK